MTDSRTLIAYIASSNQRQVIYSPDDGTYTPDYSQTPNTLYPELYVAGGGSNRINEAQSVTWSVQTNSMGAFEPVIANSTYKLGDDHSLIIQDNVLEYNNSMTYKVDIIYADEVTGRDILIQSDFEIVKLSNGASGVGEDALVAVLTNDSQVIPTNSDGGNGNYNDVTSSMLIYEGTEDKTSEWTITFKPSTGVEGEAISDTPDLYDESLTSDNYLNEDGSLAPPLEDTKLSTYIGISPDTSYEYKQVFNNEMVWSDPSFYYWGFYDVNKNLLKFGGFDDSSHFLAPGESKTLTHTIKAEDIPDNAVFIRIGGNFQTEGATFKALETGVNAYRVTDMTADSGEVTFTATKLNKTLTKQFSLSKAKAGNSSYLWVRYAQDSDGTGMTTNPMNAVYIGTTITNTPSPPTTASSYQWAHFKGEDGIGIPGEDGRTSYLHIRYSDDGGQTFTANNGESEGAWMGTYTDFTEADSSDVTKYTWAKVKGEDATSYKLIATPTVIKKTETGALTPSIVTVTAKSQTGESDLVNYSGRFVIEINRGSGYTTAYTSSANEYTKNYAVPTDVLETRVRLYKDGGTNTLLDEQTITTVADGADGIVLVITTPDGSTVRNGEGSLTANGVIYKGGKEVTGSTYQWYKMNPSGAGDADSGTGWDKLTGSNNSGTSGYTTKNLIIPASAIASSATFMVIVNYSGEKYRQQVTVNDITDPYEVQVLGTEFFKNAQGTNTYTAKVYQSGREIDVNGSLYTYKWNVYSTTGTLDTSFNKTGKTITVNASEYSGKGSLTCTVSD